MKAILLIRVSTYSQDLLQQKNEVIKEALKDGYNEKDLIIIEDKESASKLSEEERNGLNTLKEYIYNDTKKEINCVYIYELSRLSRKTQIIYNIRQFLLDRKIQLICMKPYIKMLNEDGTTTQSSDIVFAIYAANAESETMIRLERITRGKNKLKAENKHYTGKPKFGYKTAKDKSYIIDEKNSDIVKTIYRLYISKEYSMSQISEILKDRGIFKKSNENEIKTKILGILNDKNYTGNEKYPKIINLEDYEKAEEIRKNKKCYNTKNIYILKKLLKDKESNYVLIANGDRYKLKNKTHYNKDIKGISVKLEWIEEVIKNYAIELHQKYKDKKYSSKELFEINHSINTTLISIENLKELLNNYQSKIDKIEERLILGKISNNKAEELENTIQSEMQKTNYKLQLYKERLQHLNELLISNNNKKETTINYDLLDRNELKEFVKSIINCIYISKPKRNITRIEIHNKYNNEIEIQEYKSICSKAEYKRIL